MREEEKVQQETRHYQDMLRYNANQIQEEEFPFGLVNSSNLGSSWQASEAN